MNPGWNGWSPHYGYGGGPSHPGMRPPMPSNWCPPPPPGYWQPYGHDGPPQMQRMPYNSMYDQGPRPTPPISNEPGIPGEDPVGPPGINDNNVPKSQPSSFHAFGGGWPQQHPQSPSLCEQQPPTDTTPATTVNGVQFNIAGQRIPGSNFNPFPSQLLNQSLGATGKKKKRKKNKGPSTQGFGIPLPNSPATNGQVISQQKQQTYNSVPPPGPSQARQQQIDASSPLKSKQVPSSQLASNSQEWPDSLKNYVNSCFSKCITDMDKDQVEIILKGKITQAASSKTLWSKDWASEPLPSNLSVDVNKVKPAPQPAVSFALRGKGRGNLRGFDRRQFGSRAPIDGSKRRRRESSSSSSDSDPRSSRFRRRSSPDFGKNPNCIPLGKGSKSQKSGKFLGSKRNRDQKKLRSQKIVRDEECDDASFLFADGRNKMTVDDDLATRERKQKRAARFADGRKNKYRKPQIKLSTLNDQLLEGENYEDSANFEEVHVVGTCQDLEKRYLRLTAAPEAHMVRPVKVLIKSLEMVIQHWKTKSDYHYACDQLKSIRQDLTVQGVRDLFAIKVYETHGRIALEKGDFTEFNQCQSQLKMLYHEIGGENKLEFTAYRILYYMYTDAKQDLTSALAELTKEEKLDPCLAFVLKLRRSWSFQNYHRFFQLYLKAPKMTGYLIDWFAPRVRKVALRILIKSYRVTIPTEFIMEKLAFTDKEQWGKFIEPFNLKFTDAAKSCLDCKLSMSSLTLI